MGTILLPILTVPSEFLYCEHVLHRSLLKYVFDKCILGIDSCVAKVPELSDQMWVWCHLCSQPGVLPSGPLSFRIVWKYLSPMAWESEAVTSGCLLTMVWIHNKDSLNISSLLVACLVTQLCLTLCDPRDWSPPGSSVCGILQARIPEWVAVPSSRGSSQPRDWTCNCYILCIGRQVLCQWCYLGSPRRG